MRAIAIGGGVGLALLGAAALLGACRAADTPPTGEALYLRYCASCHGAAADGAGPLAGSLKRPPADLRTIARRSGGSFDESRVMAIIDGKQGVAEHGPREMPVWGEVFDDEMRGERYTAYTTLLRTRALADYLRSIQVE